jgi:hypothetical protein
MPGVVPIDADLHGRIVIEVDGHRGVGTGFADLLHDLPNYVTRINAGKRDSGSTCTFHDAMGGMEAVLCTHPTWFHGWTAGDFEGEDNASDIARTGIRENSLPFAWSRVEVTRTTTS